MLSSDTISNTNTICCLHPGHRTMELATIGFIVACFITSASSQCPTGSDMVTQPDGSPLACSSNTPCPNPYFCASGVCCINCPANQEWNNCGSACNRTCEAPNPICILSCAPGCHCPANAPIWRSDQCISQDECKCDKPVEIGPCDGIFPRWYHFNGQCLPFYYGGCGGYDNNFQSEADCIRACQSGDIKKCPSDSPVVNITTGNELNCGIGGETCPERTFCNADPFGRFDVCCPVCNQRVDTGKCRGYLPRWYFNSVTNRCQNFIYGGCGGNANRFVTEHECQRQCPPLPGKCPSGHPLLGPTGAELTCRTQPCPKGSFCKTHPADAYTVCCPYVPNQCPSGPPLPELFCGRGPGRQECPPGTYCSIAPDDRFAVCCPDACPAGAPVLDDNGSIRYCNLRSCPKGSFCHPHYSIPSAVCCPDVPMKCPNGSPLVDSTGTELICGRGLGSEKCPSGTYCNLAPGDRLAVCCPDMPIKCPKGAPLVDSTGTELFCGRGLGRQQCPPGTYCNTAPDDSFAVCCLGTIQQDRPSF